MPKSTRKPRVSGPTQSKEARRDAGRTRVDVWLSEEAVAWLDDAIESEGGEAFFGLPETAVKRGRAGAIEFMVQWCKTVEAACQKHPEIAEKILRARPERFG